MGNVLTYLMIYGGGDMLLRARKALYIKIVEQE